MAYVPGPVPTDPADLSEYVLREFLQISANLIMVEEGQFLKVWKEAPGKPREGMLAVAPGAPGWNPGSGKGLYEYKSGSWVKL